MDSTINDTLLEKLNYASSVWEEECLRVVLIDDNGEEIRRDLEKILTPIKIVPRILSTAQRTIDNGKIFENYDIAFFDGSYESRGLWSVDLFNKVVKDVPNFSAHLLVGKDIKENMDYQKPYLIDQLSVSDCTIYNNKVKTITKLIIQKANELGLPIREKNSEKGENRPEIVENMRLLGEYGDELIEVLNKMTATLFEARKFEPTNEEENDTLKRMDSNVSYLEMMRHSFAYINQSNHVVVNEFDQKQKQNMLLKHVTINARKQAQNRLIGRDV